MRPLLGTYVEIGAQSQNADVSSAIDAAFAAIGEIQAALSFHDSRSELSRLNMAGGDWVDVHPHGMRVLRLACAMTQASGGRFNCTVGGALVRKGVLPDHGCGDYLDRGHADDIELCGNRARLRRPVRITLDGIAKGYAVDCAVRALRRCGIVAGWVNAGGDLRAFGELVLPVERRESDGRRSMLGGLRDAAVASSCVRDRPDRDFPAWIVGGGVSPEVGVWTVMARTAWRADALTKVASVAAAAEREALVRRLGGRLVSGRGA